MRPRTRAGRAAAVAALVLAVLLLVALLAAVGWTAYWVDVIPGGDAGLATSPELEAGHLATGVLGLSLLVLGLVSAVLLRHAARRRRGAR